MHRFGTDGRHTAPDTGAILDNAIWIVEQLDEHGLAELSDIPVLELAKHIVVGQRAAA
jgi:hypothetical protein